MGNIYEAAFRTILNDCRKLIIPVINEIFGETYTGDEEIRFFPNEHFLDQQDNADKERITDTNAGDMMSGALIETSARKLKNEAENETKRNTALRMLKRGKMTIEEIAEDAGLSVSEVEQLAGFQTV